MYKKRNMLTKSEVKVKLHNLREVIVEGYKEGKTLRQLGRLHGASAGAIRNVLIKEQVPRRGTGRKRKNVNHSKDVQPNPVQNQDPIREGN